MQISYAQFADAFGADWTARLKLVTLPSCALTTPQLDHCLVPTDLPTVNNVRDKSLAADLSLPTWTNSQSEKEAALRGTEVQGVGDGPLVVGLLAGGSSDIGDYTKTDFHPNYAWRAGGSGGAFTLSYPMQVPPVPGSLVPQVELQYSSSNADGQTVGVNVQPFWGEGWNYTPGYIERSYRPCKDDTAGTRKYAIATSDPCWRLPNARMVLGGKSVELILGDDGKWRTENDDAAKVELLTNDTETYNYNDEHWKVGTPDGTVYHFGLSRLPGWIAGDRETGSVLGEPVFSNHDSEPCVDAQGVGWTTSWCPMAYRWNLDYVVDRNGSTMSLWYSKEINYTALAGNPNQLMGYDRYGTLDRIEYGTRVGTGATREPRPNATPAAQVVFVNVDRCLSGTCPTRDRANYPDTAWDLNCTAAPCSNNMSPSFWSAKRVAQIVTEIYSGSGTTYNRVDEWALGAEFPGDASGNPLWLSSITRTGKVNGTAALPPIQFSGTAMRNRADWDPSGAMAEPKKYRITSLRNETGGQTDVTYSAQDTGCQFGSSFPDPDNNTKLCFPRYWTNPSGSSGWAWWHKYLVTKVVQKDLVSGSPDVETAYAYNLDGAQSSTGPVVLWGYDRGSMVFSTATDYKSWAEWRGYSSVTTTTGTVTGQQSQTKVLYFRGLHGDRTDAGYFARNATLTNSLGEVVNDELDFAGMAYETQTLDGPGGQVVTKSIADPARYLTGTRSTTSDWAVPPTSWSYIVRPARDRTLTWLPLTNSWRTTDKATAWNTIYGVIDKIDDIGDPSPAASGDDICVRNFYTFPAGTAPYLISYPNRAQTVGVRCATTPSLPTDAISDVRSFYDGATNYSTAPTNGNVTRVDSAVSYTGTIPNLITIQTTGYDAWGRIVSAKNGIGHEGQTIYTHTGGLVSSMKMINPLGHEGIKSIDRARGLPLTTTDPNLKVTTGTYDPLGRLTKVWQPGTLTSGTPDTEYQYTLQSSGPSYIRTRKLGPNGNQIDTYELFDGQLRRRQTQNTAPSGKRTIEDTQYDKRGLEIKRSVFYNSASGPVSTLVVVDAAADAQIDQQHRFVYDQVGRRTGDELWSLNSLKFATGTVYQGDRTATVPPSGGTLTQDLLDVRGRVIEKRMFKTASLTGPFDAMTYQYNKAGHLALVADALNSQWSYEYDLLGRRTKTTDPDSGVTVTAYDNADRVTSVKDARNYLQFFDYDDLGRKTKQRIDAANGTITASWLYDTVAKGQLTSSTRHDASGDFVSSVGSYDDGYRPLSTTFSAPGFGTGGNPLAYTVTNTYKPNGSPATQTLPGVGGLPLETLTNTYDSTGRMQTLAGAWTGNSQTYINSIEYHYDGLIYREFLGNTNKRARLTNEHDLATRRLSHLWISVETATPNSYQVPYDYMYGYDNAGNVKSIASNTHGVADQEECFSYNYLRELAEAWTQTSGACTPQSAGADPYRRQWAYDAIGNRATQKEVAATNTDWTYQLGGTNVCGGAVKPHQLRQIDAAGPLSGTALRTFCFDAAGNMTRRTTETGVVQTLAWDKESHLQSVADSAGTANYVYNTEGGRLVSRTIAKDTLYLPDGTELEKTNSNGSILGTRYYAGIAVRSAGGLKWIAGNHQASAVVQIDSVTLGVSRRRFMPYGEARGSQPTWVGTKGYVGGTSDAAGLTHLGAREYDASIGRFLSVDPILDPGNPRQWHGYTYSHNSPVTFADPSGLKTDWSEEQRVQNAPKKLSGHNAVVAAYGIFIWVSKTLTGVKGTVKMDLPGQSPRSNRVVGGSGNQPGVNDGFADIVFWGEDAVYVWEVKPGNAKGRAEGKADLARYIAYLQKQLIAAGDPRPVLAGTWMPALPFIPSSEGWMRAWMEVDSPGLIFYGASSPPSVPVPVPVIIPTPLPAPQPGPTPRTVPRVATPAQQPTPVTPWPTPNPWGPYGTPGYVCSSSGMLACGVSVEQAAIIAMLAAGLAAGAVLAPEITLPVLGGGIVVATAS